MKKTGQDPGDMKIQACTVWSLYFSWILLALLYPGGLAYLAYKGEWAAFLVWLVFIPCYRWAYLRYFPRISRWIGYGQVEDRLPASVNRSRVEVTFYTLLGCPFCPIVERRLESLRKQMNFSLTTIDLTLKPQLATSKGIRSVPVVEAGSERLVGNATTEQLAGLIEGARQVGPSPAV